MEFDIEKRLAELEEEKNKLLREKAALEAMSEDERLAIELHNIMCTLNHADGCDWYYFIKNGVHQWNDGAGHESHPYYLRVSRALMALSDDQGWNFDSEDFMLILRTLKETR